MTQPDESFDSHFGTHHPSLTETDAPARIALDASLAAVITINEQGVIESVNAAANRLFGSGEADMVGQHLRNLMTSPDRENCAEYLAKYLATGRKNFIGRGREVMGQRLDGTIFSMLLSVNEVWLGEQRKFTAVACDITNLGKAIGKLEESESRSRAILQSAADAVITIDERGEIESLNATAENLFGYSHNELIGQNISLLMPSPYREDHDNYINAYLRTGQRKILGISRDVVGCRKDGTTFPMELAVSEAKPGGQRHFTAIIRDITSRKAAERQLKYFASQLQERNLELSRSNEELERFTYAVSHDLKSPLVTIKGFVGRLQRHVEAGEFNEIEDYLSRISNAADRMGSLLDNLLTYSRVGRVVNPHEDIPLADLAREVIELCDISIQDRGMQVTLNEQLPVIRGDRFRLVELLQNLVENSVKFTKDVPNPQLEIGTFTKWQQTVCYVRDNGIGIEQPQQQHIFNLFEQLNREVPGSGIGLAMAKRIVESHGGRIWVESDGIGSGCTMCFTLPAAENSSS
ncbi:Sensor protein FixL [Symmachiella dynata]|uniref:sensor histidine kinase n=1 Tax=Symmachiella dynata TaxID=2527995 RepID=UPI0011893FBE|nr:PAS domain S-box protein [Symmachiella dynata]QDT50558.1 Sensor protein FixL [Symmachiella dynata]